MSSKYVSMQHTFVPDNSFFNALKVDNNLVII